MPKSTTSATPSVVTPQDTVEPSELDWETMRQDGELIMGVCAIRKTAKRRFVSFALFNRSREHVQLTIAEAQDSAWQPVPRPGFAEVQ